MAQVHADEGQPRGQARQRLDERQAPHAREPLADDLVLEAAADAHPPRASEPVASEDVDRGGEKEGARRKADEEDVEGDPQPPGHDGPESRHPKPFPHPVKEHGDSDHGHDGQKLTSCLSTPPRAPCIGAPVPWPALPGWQEDRLAQTWPAGRCRLPNLRRLLRESDVIKPQRLNQAVMNIFIAAITSTTPSS
ncbi:MAG: hypothetical protein A2V83_11085 [Nitrospirae bacterium RBG_16_64_22]|nr:MAG: hypothetical protein A2V83_11085 [Nitrospirae bacterium RBG_16_64_22]